MFSRMQQQAREAAGKAQATGLPDDIASKMNYVEKWDQRDKKLISAMTALTTNWKKNAQRVAMLKAADELADGCENELKTGATELKDFLQARIEKEKNAHEQGTVNFEKGLKTFFNGDLKTLKEALKDLKRKRLNRDKYVNHQGDPGKMAALEISEAQLAQAITDTRERIAKIPEVEQMHADLVNQLMAAFTAAYEDGR